MIVQTIKVNDCTPQTIVIGRRGTYDTLQIAFDMSYLVESYGNGVAVLAVKRSQDESAYPAVVTQEDNTLTWTVSETDTYYVGAGEAQLMWYVDGGLAKTIIYPCVVMKDILATSEEAPDAYQEWVDDLTTLGAETLQNAQDAAQSASDAEAAKDDAVAAKEAAEAALDEFTTPTASATTLSAGSEATATYSDGNFAFGIPRGADGDPGDPGVTPNFSIGTVTTLEPTQPATATITGTAEAPVLNLGIPKGAKGDPGQGGGSVDSVNGQTGNVVLDAGDLEFDDTETYAAGSIGAEVSAQKNAISELENGLGSDLGTTYINERSEIVNASSKVISIPGIENFPAGTYNIVTDYSGDYFNYIYFIFYDASNNTVLDGRINAPGTTTVVLSSAVRKAQFYVYLTTAETATVHVTVKTEGEIDKKFAAEDVKINAVSTQANNRIDELQQYVDDNAIDEILHRLFVRKNYLASSNTYEDSTKKIAITKPLSFDCDIAVKASPGYSICIIDVATPPSSVSWFPGGYITAGTVFNIVAMRTDNGDFPLSESNNVVFEPIDIVDMFRDSDTFIDRLKNQLTYAYLSADGKTINYYQYKNLMNVNKLYADKDVYIENPLSDICEIRVTIYDAAGNVVFNNMANKNNPRQIRNGQYFRLTFTKASNISVNDVFAGATVSLSESICVNNPEQSNIIPALSNKGFQRENDPGKRYTAMVFTDIHADYPRFYRIMDYINETSELDSGICLGDMANDHFAETDGTWYTNAVNNCNKPFYTVIGNHDGGNRTDMSKSGTVQQVFEKWIEPTVEQIGIADLTKSYYSKTFDEYNLCLIVLNDFDVPDTVVSGAFAVSRGQQCYSQAQIDWLVQTLGAIPANYHVAILQHWIGFENQSSNDEFSQYGFNRIYNDPAYEDIIIDIVNAWQTGSVLSKLYTPIKYTDYLPTLEVSCDYTSRGAGIFAGYISGHLHCDFIGKSTKYVNQNVIGLCMSTLDANYSDLPRKIGTKSEDVVTSISFDTTNRSVILNRIGACVTDRATVKQFAKIVY